MFRKFHHWIWLGIAVIASAASAQNEIGLPIVRNFTPKEYGGVSDNWAIVQDGRGLIYVANGAGILEYDGSKWRIIPVANQSVVRWLTKDSNGTIYAATQGDLGRLESDASGRMHFVSLLGNRMRDSLKLGDVWETESTSEGVYARSFDRIIRWSPKGIKSWTAERFDLISVVRDTLYTRIRGKGIVMIVGDSIRLVPGGEKFDLKINAVLPFRNQLLFATRRDGLFLYDGKTFTAFQTDFDEYLKNNSIYHGIVLQDGRFVFATLHGGVTVFDQNGKLQKVLSRFAAVQDDNVCYVFQDRSGALWMALGNGISRLDISSAVSQFDENLGLSGYVNSIVRHSGSLYAATVQGLFRLNVTTGGQSHFELISKEKSNYQDIVSQGKDLIASGANGVDIFSGTKTIAIKLLGSGALLPLRGDPDRVLVARQVNMHSISRNISDGIWKDNGAINGIYEFISDMTQDSSGFVWAATWFQGVLRIDFSHGFSDHPSVERYGPLQGIPEGATQLVTSGNRWYIKSDAGILQYNSAENRFIPVPNFLDSLMSSSAELNLVINRNLGLVFKAFLEKGLPGARGMVDKLWRTGESQPASYHKDTNGVEWFGGHYRIIRDESTGFQGKDRDLMALIRRVIIGADSILYGGFHRNDENVSLPYDPSGIRFEYASLQFDPADLHVYQYQLDGLEKKWSHWSNQQSKEYSNLPEGSYRFRVRAMNPMGQISSEDSFAFIIRPPWQRSGWAYILYVLASVLVLYGGTKWRLRQLQKKNDDLERNVEKRTHELESALKELKETEMQLVQSEKMASIGHMVAGIAHEINNPLTFIIPNLEYIKAHLKEQESVNSEAIQAIDSSIYGGQRIREVVSNLRTFTGIDAEAVIDADIEMHLDFAVDLLVQRDAEILIEKHYGQKRYLRVNINELNQCFVNILTNAIQAIRDAENKNILRRGEGRITIATDYTGEHARITIGDNGIGIPKEVLPKVFEPFFTTRSIGQGRGLGLAETYAIIKNHHGTTQVFSESGKGSQFVITLPIN